MAVLETSATDAVNGAYDGDPYLAAMPSFAYSMPIQLVMVGVTLSLLTVLLIHLLFTMRYHVPLSRLNYAFQTLAVVLSMVRTTVALGSVLSVLIIRPKEWPYMFDYIEVMVPPSTWNVLTLRSVGDAESIRHGSDSRHTHPIPHSPLPVRSRSSTHHGPSRPTGNHIVRPGLHRLVTASSRGRPRRRDPQHGQQHPHVALHARHLHLGVQHQPVARVAHRGRHGHVWRRRPPPRRPRHGGKLHRGEGGPPQVALGRRHDVAPVAELGRLLVVGRRGHVDGRGRGRAAARGETATARPTPKRPKRLAKLSNSNWLSRRNSLKHRRSRRRTPNDDGQSTRTGITLRSRRQRPVAAAPPEDIELQPIGNGAHQQQSGSQQSASSETGSTNQTPPPPRILAPLVALIRPFMARLRVAHNEAAIKRAAEPRSAEAWGVRHLGLRGQREVAQAAAEAGAVGSISAAQAARAGFELDGGQRLDNQGDDAWEDEHGDSEEATESSEESDARSRRPRPRPNPPAVAVSASRPGARSNRWTQRGIIAKWRIKDRQEYP